MAETPVLQVEHLTMRYGEGCPHCKDHLEKNRCTVCGTVWAANDISLESSMVASTELSVEASERTFTPSELTRPYVVKTLS